jgi:ribosome maturation factor RimP
LDILTTLENLVKPLVEDMGAELVELQFNRGKRTSVRIFVWEDGGISLDKCTAISREVSDLLDRKDVINGKYFLEVSSPGIDRPLVTQRDYERQIGRKVKIIKRLDEKKTNTIVGQIESATETSVRLLVDKESVELNFDEIVSAKIKVEF